MLLNLYIHFKYGQYIIVSIYGKKKLKINNHRQRKRSETNRKQHLVVVLSKTKHTVSFLFKGDDDIPLVGKINIKTIISMK